MAAGLKHISFGVKAHFPKLCLLFLTAVQTSYAQNLDVLIQDLTNKNPTPVRVELPSGSAPLFSDDYDWNEDLRVAVLLNGISKLAAKKPDTVWRALIEVKNDEYCICLKYPNGSGISGEVLSVREICHRAAMRVLMEPIAAIDVADERGLPPYLPVFKGNEFEDWISKRPHERLFELQRVVLHRAVDREEEIGHLSEPNKAKFVEELRRRESLWSRKTKSEIKQRIFLELDRYSPRDAHEIAKRSAKP